VTGRFKPARRSAAVWAAAACVFFAGGCVSTVRYGRPFYAGTTERGKLWFDSVAANIRGPVEPDRLKKIFNSYLGTPYQWGGMSKKGVDCSGLVCLVFRELYTITLPRSAVDMVNLGSAVQPAETRAGDLVFFRWGFFGTVDHVGICTGEGRFVHASSKHGVIESSLNDEYYGSHLIAARRLFQ
jgi:lipoprotein Spr/probable lipoprotein NlpC